MVLVKRELPHQLGPAGRECSIEGCTGRSYQRTLCHRHLRKIHRETGVRYYDEPRTGYQPSEAMHEVIGVHLGTWMKYLNNTQQPGLRASIGIAKAFHLTGEEFYELAVAATEGRAGPIIRGLMEGLVTDVPDMTGD